MNHSKNMTRFPSVFVDVLYQSSHRSFPTRPDPPGSVHPAAPQRRPQRTRGPALPPGRRPGRRRRPSTPAPQRRLAHGRGAAGAPGAPATAPGGVGDQSAGSVRYIGHRLRGQELCGNVLIPWKLEIVGSSRCPYKIL